MKPRSNTLHSGSLFQLNGEDKPAQCRLSFTFSMFTRTAWKRPENERFRRLQEGVITFGAVIIAQMDDGSLGDCAVNSKKKKFKYNPFSEHFEFNGHMANFFSDVAVDFEYLH